MERDRSAQNITINLAKDDAYLTVNQSDKRKVSELHEKFSKYMTYTVNRPNIKTMLWKGIKLVTYDT